MTVALSVNNLRKVYDNGFEALKGISFDVQQGDFMALLGPNGAGKSTTLGDSLLDNLDAEVSEPSEPVSPDSGVEENGVEENDPDAE